MQRNQQRSRFAGSLLLAAGLIGVAAADTRFDFETPGLDQEGDYVAEPGAVLTGGVATLGLTGSPDWAVPTSRDFP